MRRSRFTFLWSGLLHEAASHSQAPHGIPTPQLPAYARCCSSSSSSSSASALTPLTAATAVAALRPTRVLLRTEKFLSPAEAVDLAQKDREMRHSSLGTTPLEMNLLEDPTAGLATGPAEELTPTELETLVRVLVSSYTPSVYRLLYTPFIDVVHVLVREGLMPQPGDAKLTTTTTITAAAAPAGMGGAGGSSSGAGYEAVAPPTTTTVSTSYRPVRAEEVVTRWFTDGAATLKHPHATAEAMGKRRWAHFCRALEAHWADMEEVMPLTRVVRRHGLREDLYVPMLRQLSMELVDSTKRQAAVTTLPGLILSLANGRAPRTFGLPERDADRIHLVSSLFLGVGQETGNTDLAYLALQLLRANNMETPFSAQKQLTNVFAAAARIETDWQMRAAGLLVECFPKWREYHRQVQQDNKVALMALQEADRSGASNGGSDEKEGAEASTAADDDEEGRGRSMAHLRKSGSSGAQDQSSSISGREARTKTEGQHASTEQYRYFTSRSHDDVARITALEENIEAAVRGRAAELKAVRMRRRSDRRPPSAGSQASNADSAELAEAGDAAVEEEEDDSLLPSTEALEEEDADNADAVLSMSSTGEAAPVKPGSRQRTSSTQQHRHGQKVEDASPSLMKPAKSASRAKAKKAATTTADDGDTIIDL